MKYLVLLGLLVGCQPLQLYNKGDCFKLVSLTRVTEFYVEDIIGTIYIVAVPYKKDNNVVYATTGLVPFDFKEITKENSVKFECESILLRE